MGKRPVETVAHAEELAFTFSPLLSRSGRRFEGAARAPSGCRGLPDRRADRREAGAACACGGFTAIPSLMSRGFLVLALTLMLMLTRLCSCSPVPEPSLGEGVSEPAPLRPGTPWPPALPTELRAAASSVLPLARPKFAACVLARLGPPLATGTRGEGDGVPAGVWACSAGADLARRDGSLMRGLRWPIEERSMRGRPELEGGKVSSIGWTARAARCGSVCQGKQRGPRERRHWRRLLLWGQGRPRCLRAQEKARLGSRPPVSPLHRARNENPRRGKLQSLSSGVDGR
jgi:hypothetical protein